MLLLLYSIIVLSDNIWLEPEPKLWTKMKSESEPKINHFGAATLSVFRICIYYYADPGAWRGGGGGVKIII